MKRKNLLILILVFALATEGYFLLDRINSSKVSAASWQTADDIMIMNENGGYVDDSGKYRWFKDTMMEIKFDNGNTWIVDQNRVKILNRSK